MNRGVVGAAAAPVTDLGPGGPWRSSLPAGPRLGARSEGGQGAARRPRERSIWEQQSPSAGPEWSTRHGSSSSP